MKVPFHVVLVEPEIPPNTGNVGRLCAATGSKLHLVGKLGFRIDEHAVRRAGLDYWHLVDLTHHLDFPHFLRAFRAASPTGKLHLFTAHAKTSYLDAGFAPGDALVFGKESVGLAPELVEEYNDRTVAIPTFEVGPADSAEARAVRSLNLSNAVSIALYEALRGAGALAKATLGE